jgi:glycosyltransferase involved in cell wall biosynthesis
MRIAVFHNLPSGGAKRAMVEMIRQLRQAGDTVDVLAPSTADEQFFPSRSVATSVRIWETSEAPGSGRGRIPIPALGRRLRVVAAVQREIAHAIDSGNYDVAFVHHCRFTQSPFVLRYLETPAVYYCQEPYRLAYEARLQPSLQVRLRLWSPVIGIARMDRANIGAADRILANSFYSRESILRAYGLDSSVVYLGVDTQTFRPASAAPGREAYVISVGALASFKGHRHVVRSLGLIPSQRRPSLIVVADRSAAGEEAALADLAASLDVEVQIKTGVNDAELVRLYQGARLAVCASELEPFGLVALEAAACGTPVVAIREGGFRETVDPGVTGLLVDDRRPESLAAAMEDLLNDETRRSRLGAAGVQAVRERWTWQHTGERLREHLQTVSSLRPAPSTT